MILREFLVAITYQVNNYKAFASSITLATTGFGSLTKAAAAAGSAVTAVVGKIADDLDKLYFVSQRTRASADNIAAFGYAARQTGSSAEAMAGSIENMASRLRRLPGLTQMLGNMGIDGRGDPTQIMLRMYQRLSALPEYVQLLHADMFGIDDKTWLALKNMGQYIEERKMIARSMGVDMDRAAKSANTLWTQLRRLGTTIEVIAAKAVDSLGTRYARTFQNFTNMLIRNGDKIAKMVEGLVDLFLKLVQAVGAVGSAFGNVGGRIYDWFVNLDPVIQKVILGFGGLLVAWRLLSAGMLATPLGRILAAITGLVLLLDDYMVWKDRGKGENGSLYDWSWLEDNIFTQVGEAFRAAGEYARRGWQWLIDIVEWMRTSSLGQRLVPSQPSQMGRVTPGEGVGARVMGWARGALAGGGAAPTQDQENEAREIDRVLQDMGFGPAQRAAILANIGRESGFNPRAENWERDRNGNTFLSYGLFQHNRERLEAMMRHFGVNDRSQLTRDMQLLWFYNEITGGQEAGRAGRFFGAQNPRDAARAMSQDLIRPADRLGLEAERRANDAEMWQRRLGAPTGTVSPGAATPGATPRDQGAGVINLTPTAYINVTTPDAATAARQVLAGQDNLHQGIIRNLRPRIV